MSVINQVLNKLEQRGAHLVADQAMVRPVPLARDTRRLKIALAVSGLCLAAGVLAWLWSLAGPMETAANSIQLKPATGLAEPLSGAAAEPVAQATAPVSRLSLELATVQLPAIRAAAKNAGIPSKPSPAKESSEQANVPNAPVTGSSGDMPMKQISRAQQAEAEFRRATLLMQQGRSSDALAGYEAALHLDAGHDAARQALVALLLDGRRGQDAERVLQDGIRSRPEHTGFAMLLARLQVERDAVDEALATLEKFLPYADQQADYQAFFAALLQRRDRHKEAVARYQVALRLVPNKAVWLMGYGISLQALQRNADAKDAFRRALDTQTLGGDLQAIVQQKFNAL